LLAALRWPGRGEPPVAFAATDGWKEFYTFSAHRGADFGSVWYVLAQAGHRWAT